jgi:nicotinate-nucleotide adenylyltransferase
MASRNEVLDKSGGSSNGSSQDGVGRLCLFGGTFDPVHKAHLRIGLVARERFQLDRVLLIPAGQPPHKPAAQVTAYEDRYRMVELACLGQSGLEASRLEDGPGQSYTVDTLERCHREMRPRELYFLIGSDAFDEIETWHRWRDILRLTDFLVVTRPGHAYRSPAGARVHRIDGVELPISSSGIRARLAAGEPTPELPGRVRRYIEEHSLYGAVPSEHADERE